MNDFAINKSDFNTYLRLDSNNTIINYIDTLEEDEDEYNIYCMKINLNGNYSYTYHELWLIDVNDSYIPLIVEDINTSSPHALWSSSLINDHSDDEITDDEFTDDDGKDKDFYRIIQLVNKKYENFIKNIFSKN